MFWQTKYSSPIRPTDGALYPPSLQIPHLLFYVPLGDGGDELPCAKIYEIKLAFMEAAWRRLCRDKATIIQCMVRQHFSRLELARLREERRILERDMATRIQANARSEGSKRSKSGLSPLTILSVLVGWLVVFRSSCVVEF